MDNVDADVILFNNNLLYPYLKKGIEIVKEFIIKNKLILKGGQAIDYALRLRDSKIYEDHVIPDFDFYSSDHYADAIKLGNILCKQGLPNISVINAIHNTTIRVRINFIEVADITYCPKIILDSYKTLMYNDMKVLHPINQIVDIHRSLCHGWENAPMFVCLNRWKKDATRLNLLLEYYDDMLVYKDTTTKSITIPIADIKDAMLTGLLAEALISNKYRVQANNIIFDIYSQDTTILDIYYNKGDDRLPELGFTNNSIHNVLLDYHPVWWEQDKDYGKCHIYELSKDYINASKISIGEYTVYAANYNHILMFYLLRDDIISYTRLITFVKDNQLPLTLDKFGNLNMSLSYMYSAAKFYDKKGESDKIPKNVYPSQEDCNSKGVFEYDSYYFKIDGK